jgi:hypothetical protein
MSWAICVGAAVSVVGGYMSQKSGEKSEDKKSKLSIKQMGLQHQYNEEESAFNAAQDYYYKQKERGTRQRGLDEFRKFSTTADFAPNYQDTGTRVEVPDKPQVDTYGQPAPAGGGGGGGGGGLEGLLTKPIDVHKKILKGLF